MKMKLQKLVEKLCGRYENKLLKTLMKILMKNWSKPPYI